MARRAMSSWAVAMGLACVMACSSDDQSSPPSDASLDTAPTTTTPAPVAPALYLAEVEDVVRAHAFYAGRIDWAAWQAQAVTAAAEAQDSADTYSLVDELLVELDDRHSAFLRPQPGRKAHVADTLTEDATPSGGITDAIGLLELPGVAFGPDTEPGLAYATAARQVLADDACGWIVDLRRNTGGDLATMLLAIAPLTGPGPSAAYRDRDGSTVTFTITDDGGVEAPGRPTSDLEPDRGHTFRPHTEPVAVLYSSETASSGEGVAIALRARPATRSFGTPTSGRPTSRQGFELADGSTLLLTTAIGVDAHGTTYENPIPPDVEILGPDVLDTTHAWLSTQPSCRQP